MVLVSKRPWKYVLMKAGRADTGNIYAKPHGFVNLCRSRRVSSISEFLTVKYESKLITLAPPPNYIPICTLDQIFLRYIGSSHTGWAAIISSVKPY